MSARGIRVDSQGRTNVPNIWACGDVTGRHMLAHVGGPRGDRRGQLVFLAALPERHRQHRLFPPPPKVSTVEDIGRAGRLIQIARLFRPWLPLPARG